MLSPSMKTTFGRGPSRIQDLPNSEPPKIG
jgi:hypothetical protein